MRFFTRALVTFLALTCDLGSVHAREFLEHGDLQHDSYYDAIRRVMPQGWQDDVILRFIDIPGFQQKEAITGVRRTETGYRAFAIVPSEQISIEMDKHSDLSKLRADYRERPIGETLARRYVAFWNHILGAAQNYKPRKGLYIDTSVLYFFVRSPNGRSIAAHMWEVGPKTRQLMYVANDFYMFCRHPDEISESKIAGFLAKSERLVGME
jgi:hypothetical protein